MGAHVEQIGPGAAVERRLLVQEHEVGVEHHVAGLLVVEHVDAVLRDARGDEVELAALRPVLREVADDGGVPEERLHLVDVEPGRDAALVVVVHAVSDALKDGDDAEGAHVLGEVLEVDVGDAPLEAHVGGVVEERQRPLHVALVAQRDVPRLGLGLLPQDAVEVAQERVAPRLGGLAVRSLHAAADDGLVRLGKALRALRHGG